MLRDAYNECITCITYHNKGKFCINFERRDWISLVSKFWNIVLNESQFNFNYSQLKWKTKYSICIIIFYHNNIEKWYKFKISHIYFDTLKNQENRIYNDFPWVFVFDQDCPLELFKNSIFFCSLRYRPTMLQLFILPRISETHENFI